MDLSEIRPKYIVKLTGNKVFVLPPALPSATRLDVHYGILVKEGSRVKEKSKIRTMACDFHVPKAGSLLSAGGIFMPTRDFSRRIPPDPAAHQRGKYTSKTEQ
jgi:hypothetical protein